MRKIKNAVLIISIMLFSFPTTVLGYENDLIEMNTVEGKQSEITDNIDEGKVENEALESKDNDIILTLEDEDGIDNTIETKSSNSNLGETKNASASSDGLVPENGIPLVIIRVDESEEAIKAAIDNDPEHDYGTIAEMNESKHHTVRSAGTIEIILPDGYVGEYDLSNNPVGEQKLSYIRGRGNSTWMISDKKPYKINYDKISDDAFKVCARSVGTEHENMLEKTDPYMTAWMLY